jgi:hypothetical protein
MFTRYVDDGLLNEDWFRTSGTAWFALIVQLSLSLSVLVAIGEIAAWFALIVQLSLSLSVLVAIGEDCRMVRSHRSAVTATVGAGRHR